MFHNALPDLSEFRLILEKPLRTYIYITSTLFRETSVRLDYISSFSHFFFSLVLLWNYLGYDRENDTHCIDQRAVSKFRDSSIMAGKDGPLYMVCKHGLESQNNLDDLLVNGC